MRAVRVTEAMFVEGGKTKRDCSCKATAEYAFFDMDGRQVSRRGGGGELLTVEKVDERSRAASRARYSGFQNAHFEEE